MWVKVFGNQWYWSYEYTTLAEPASLTPVDADLTDKELYRYDSMMLKLDDVHDQSLRLLDTDFVVTVPYDRPTKFLVTSNDVLHSWAVPAMGVKIDACPGRLSAVTILPKRIGVYYGQCSEICGVGHAFMPIVLEVVA